MYRIAKWEELYEVNSHNGVWAPGQPKRVGPLPFVRYRVNGRDWSEGYRDFLAVAGKNSASIFGVFCKLLEIAADGNIEARGLLVDRRGNSLDAEGISRISGFSVSDIRKALVVLTDSRVGWLVSDTSPESPGIPRNSLSGQVRSGQVRTIDCTERLPVGNTSAPPGDAAVLLNFDCAGDPPIYELTRGKLKEYYQLYGKQIDVLHEAKKARQWCIDNPQRRKTARRMGRFLAGWFERSVNSGRGTPPQKSPQSQPAKQEKPLSPPSHESELASKFRRENPGASNGDIGEMVYAALNKAGATQ